MTSESAEAALEHYHGAGRLDVLTFAPAESMQADYLLFREPGSRQRGPNPTMAGAPVSAAVLVDGVSARFAGYEVPGLAVLLARRADHAIGIVSRGWPLAEISLAAITDFASYESVELEDMRIVLRGAQIGLAEEPVAVHRGQPGDYVHTDGTVWTWLRRWRPVAGVHLRVYDLIEMPGCGSLMLLFRRCACSRGFRRGEGRGQHRPDGGHQVADEFLPGEFCQSAGPGDVAGERDADEQ